MSVPSLDFSNIPKKNYEVPVNTSEEFYKPVKDEKIYNYLKRILNIPYKVAVDGIIDEYLNRMKKEDGDSPFFKYSLKHIPNLWLKSSYERAGGNSSLIGIVATSLSMQKINYLINQLKDRNGFDLKAASLIWNSIKEVDVTKLSETEVDLFTRIKTVLSNELAIKDLYQNALSYLMQDPIKSYEELKKIPEVILAILPILFLDLNNASNLFSNCLSKLSAKELEEFLSSESVNKLKYVKSDSIELESYNKFLTKLFSYDDVLDMLVQKKYYKEALQIIHKIQATNDTNLLSKFEAWLQSYSNENDKFILWLEKSKNLNPISNTLYREAAKHLCHMANGFIGGKKNKGHIVFPKIDSHKKSLVAQHPPETKKNRKEAKRALESYLNLFTEYSEKNTNPAEIEEERKKHNRIEIQVKNASGQLDKYELLYFDNDLHGFRLLDKVIKNGTEMMHWRPEFEYASINSILSLDILKHIFKGDRLEVVVEEQYRYIDNSFWSDWSGTKAWDTYSKEIHPILETAVLEALDHLNVQSPNILEICAGTGLLAKKIIHSWTQKHPAQDTMIQYTLLEKNEESRSKAQLNLNEMTNVIIVENDLINDAVYFRDPAKTEPIPPNSVDVIVGSGAITHEVLQDKKQAEQAMRKLAHCLKPGGYMILSGWSHSLFSAKEFKNMGFEVINMSTPKSIFALYILKK